MKKSLILFLILTLLAISSCNMNTSANTNSHEDIIVNLPNGDTAINNTNGMPGSVNQNDVTVEKTPSKTDIQYIGSKTSKKFHNKNCTYAKKINKENLALYKTYEDFIKNGYTPCKKCLNNSK